MIDPRRRFCDCERTANNPDRISVRLLDPSDPHICPIPERH